MYRTNVYGLPSARDIVLIRLSSHPSLGVDTSTIISANIIRSIDPSKVFSCCGSIYVIFDTNLLFPHFVLRPLCVVINWPNQSTVQLLNWNREFINIPCSPAKLLSVQIYLPISYVVTINNTVSPTNNIYNI